MQIFGIGIDFIETKRLKNTIERFGERFLKRIYTQEEITYCRSQVNPFPHFAGRFCAKEAVLKAFGVGRGKLPWVDIEIVNGRGGKPQVNLHRKAKKVFSDLKGERVLVSISHTHSIAIAQAILLKGS
jgi:holo-[acyl-carrier protein] synthase